MKRIIITKAFNGLVSMQVCAVQDATDDEILAVCNRENPSGTSHGWATIAREDFHEEKARPLPCMEYPDRIHLLALC